ncbi:hypothetical protein [Rhizobium sp. L51/94]|uniref:hypothetical protein n=1 Tax=Rhizobium sp. L51/94 TaxID=2819999 RepID=UPI001C5B8D47|nr:hypothetical protein [Rhizobium sp. L51/94]QXZ79631.1 hypothetical protein J5274_06520 [Rhizobium sp. L51/94]
MRLFSDDNCGVLKAATAASYEAMGGVRRAAEALGVASSTLTKYASADPQWKDSFIRVDLAVALDRRTVHPFLGAAMRKLTEAAVVPSFGDLTAAAILRLDYVLNDVVREVVDAIDDARIDAAERTAVCERIVAAQGALAKLYSHMVAL